MAFSSTPQGERDISSWQIVLKKSDFTSDQNFAKALVRSSPIYVGDHVTNAIANGLPLQALYRAPRFRRSASTGVPRVFDVTSSLSFSTVSALSGPPAMSAVRSLSEGKRTSGDGSE